MKPDTAQSPEDLFLKVAATLIYLAEKNGVDLSTAVFEEREDGCLWVLSPEGKMLYRLEMSS